jgi:hypothetical protein
MDGGITCCGDGSQIRADRCISLLVDKLPLAMGSREMLWALAIRAFA